MEKLYIDVHREFLILAVSKLYAGKGQTVEENFIRIKNFSIKLPPSAWVHYPRLGGYEYKFNPGHQNIFIDYEGRNYLSCYIEREMSFKFYTYPFQAELWVAIGTTLITFTVLTDLFVAKTLKRRETLSSAFFYFGAFLEESSSLGSELLKHPAFRVGVGPWLLLSSILSNVYISLIMIGLNAPPPPINFDTWESLLPSLTRNESKEIDNALNDLFPLRSLNLTDMFKGKSVNLKDFIESYKTDLNTAHFEGFSLLSFPKVRFSEPKSMYRRDSYGWRSSLYNWFLERQRYYSAG